MFFGWISMSILTYSCERIHRADIENMENINKDGTFNQKLTGALYPLVIYMGMTISEQLDTYIESKCNL